MKLKWTIEVEVDPKWVADGFNLDSDRVIDMLLTDLIYASPSEVSAKIIGSPPKELIARLQGYKSIKEMEDSDAKLKKILKSQ